MIDVSKWQAAQREYVYDPVLHFFFRTLENALIDCNCELMHVSNAHGLLWARPMPTATSNWVPSDEALVARDWVARSVIPGDDTAFLSFEICCLALGIDPDKQRVQFLSAIDQAGDYDTDENWNRLDEVSSHEPADDEEPLFDALRVVPAEVVAQVVDQLQLFAA